MKTVADGAEGRVSFRYIMAVFLVTRIALCTVAVIASTMAGRPREGVPLEPLTGIRAVDAWVQWDGFWYLRIARVGYANVDYKYLTDFDAAGFLPLYPWLVRYGSVLWDQPIGVALLISNAAAVAALVVFARLASLDFPADTVRRAIFYVCAFPTSFYLSSVATESLFLFLSVSAFYAARRRQWLWAGVAGGLAALSRPVGVLLMPALACEVHHAGVVRRLEKVRPLGAAPVPAAQPGLVLLSLLGHMGRPARVPAPARCVAGTDHLGSAHHSWPGCGTHESTPASSRSSILCSRWH